MCTIFAPGLFNAMAEMPENPCLAHAEVRYTQVAQ
jgi:hypothetical protein